MKVTVNYMGQLKAAAGKGSEIIECSDDAALSDLLAAAAGQYGSSFVNIIQDETGAIRPSLIVIINDVTANKDASPSLSDGDTVTLLTAIAGG